MPRYAAFLRAVSPMNAKMPELRRCFEAAGFTEVRTVRSSGNVVFDSRATSPASLERKAEAAMRRRLGHAFLTIVRPIEALRAILVRDPYRAFRLAAGSVRLVTFLRANVGARFDLPIAVNGARILCIKGREVFSAYVPGPRGAVFMGLIEKALGREVTTRTWDTVKRVAAA
jgi:uncharacterized protein (DUF1697 family)